MILEGIVTTLDDAGAVNIAPMGPHVESESFDRFVLKPYDTSQTYRNLKHRGEGVLHVTDDVLLLARAAVGQVSPLPALRPALKVQGVVLTGACRCFEFRVLRMEESEARKRIDAEVVHRETLRDFFGFNRAKHAVLEAAILATRIAILPRPEIEAEFRRLLVLVEKTGGGQEKEAFAFLQEHLAKAGGEVAAVS